VARTAFGGYAEVMADDGDPGVDKFDVLAAINSVPPSDPGPAPLPDAELIPAAEPVPETAAPAAVPAKVSSGAFHRPSSWTKHRQEIAALIAAFVAVVWLSVGIAARAWTPSLVGVAFGVVALLIGVFEVWADD
jgi:hypothetical protein